MFPKTDESCGLGHQPLVGPEQFAQFHNAMCQLLSNIEISIDKSIEQETWTAILCTLKAKSKLSGSAIKITGSVFAKVENNQITEAYNHFDFMSLWEQLELLPRHCFEHRLDG